MTTEPLLLCPDFIHLVMARTTFTNLYLANTLEQSDITCVPLRTDFISSRDHFAAIEACSCQTKKSPNPKISPYRFSVQPSSFFHRRKKKQKSLGL